MFTWNAWCSPQHSFSSGIAANPEVATTAAMCMQCLGPASALMRSSNTQVTHSIVSVANISAAAAAASKARTVRAAAENHPRMPKPPKTSKPPSNLSDREGSPFHELGLREIMDGMGKVRVRQHVNPLSAQFQRPTPAVDWAQVFKDPSRPLFVDMGCGPGRFLLLLCRHDSRQQQKQPLNYLGLEIRQPLVERANKWSAELGMQDNVQFLFTNVSVSLAGLLQTYPGPIAAMSAQFPDPHFKRRHKKRRMVQPSVVQTARERLMPGGVVFLQSDVLDAVAAMRDEFEQHAGDVLQLSPLHTTAPVFHWTREQEYAAAAAAAAASLSQEQEDAGASSQSGQKAADSAGAGPDADSSSQFAACSSSVDAAPTEEGDGEEGSDSSDADDFVSTWVESGWLLDNPLGVPTERENYVLSQGGKVFRVLLVKKE